MAHRTPPRATHLRRCDRRFTWQILMTRPQETRVPFPARRTSTKRHLPEQLGRLRGEIHEMRTRSVTLKEATFTKWSETMAGLDGGQNAAREMLGEITASTGAAWEHLRDGARVAWHELKRPCG